jgi:dihydrofolate reductase
MTVTLVAAVARNGVIGSGGTIPWTLPGEQRQFKELTTGHVLVMGRRTYESIGRPLPGRTTVVVTRQPGWTPPGGRPDALVLATDVLAALDLAAGLDDEVFVVGGARVYADALPHADAMVLSWVDVEPPGDTYFPAVDWADWIEVERSDHDGWSRVRYRRSEPLP